MLPGADSSQQWYALHIKHHMNQQPFLYFPTLLVIREAIEWYTVITTLLVQLCLYECVIERNTVHVCVCVCVVDMQKRENLQLSL